MTSGRIPRPHSARTVGRVRLCVPPCGQKQPRKRRRAPPLPEATATARLGRSQQKKRAAQETKTRVPFFARPSRHLLSRPPRSGWPRPLRARWPSAQIARPSSAPRQREEAAARRLLKPRGCSPHGRTARSKRKKLRPSAFARKKQSPHRQPGRAKTGPGRPLRGGCANALLPGPSPLLQDRDRAGKRKKNRPTRLRPQNPAHALTPIERA